jgi:hypothetical protein
VEILPLCPFRTTTHLWEARPGQFSLTAIVKATFVLVPNDEPRIADRQEVLSADRAWDDDPEASLYAPGDHVPVKRRVDLMLVACAYAPAAEPVESLVTTFRVGDFEKSLRVTGDRLWEGERGALRPGPVLPFLRMPIRFERAELSPDNPVGIDPNAAPVPGARALPNLEIEEGSGAAAFAPVAPAWRPRRRLVTDGGFSWATAARFEGTPPPDFNFGFFNAAPRDQQIDLLRGGSVIELVNMNPEHPRFSTTVPRVRPQVFHMNPATRRAEEIILRCDSLWIDADRDLLVLTFRGVVDAGRGDPSVIGKLVVAADPRGKRLTWERVEKRLREGPGGRLHTVPGIGHGGDLDDEPRSEDPLAVRYDAVLEARPEGAPEPTMRLPEGEVAGVARSVRVDVAAAAALGSQRPSAESVAPTPRREEEGVEPTSSEAQEMAGDPRSSERSFRQFSKEQMALLMTSARRRTDPSSEGAPEKPKLARRAMTTRGGYVAPMDPGSIARYAKVSAALRAGGGERAFVLAQHGLDAEGLYALEDTWTSALAAETEAGKRELLMAFDVAYVAALERLPDPIGLYEYARIAVALERGRGPEILRDFGLELDDAIRLERVWTRRAARSPSVQDELEAELDIAHEEAERQDPTED